MPAIRYQPQGAMQLNRVSPLIAGAPAAIIAAGNPRNLMTGVPLRVAGTVGPLRGVPAGQAFPFRKNGYVESEVFPAIGTQSFVEFWHGYPSSDTGASGSAAEPGFVTGSDKNANGICATIGSNRGGASAGMWGAIYNWTSNVTINSSGEALTPGKLTLLVVVRRQSGMDFYRDGVLVRSIAQAPMSYPAQSLICGSFIEDTGYWTSNSDTMLAGRILTEWSDGDVRQFAANPWQIIATQTEDEFVAATTDGNAPLTGVAGSTTVGSIAAKGNATTTVTGIATSTAAGIIAAKGNAAALVTGAQAASSAGTISAAGGASTTLPGVQSAAQVGTITASGAATANANLPGVQATASAGTVTAAGTATATITGVQASGQPGTISASGAATATATITGVQATSQVGTLSATGAASTTLPGVQSAAQVGIVQATAGGNAITALPGIRATGAAGSISAIGSARADVTGVTATTAVGSFALSASAVAQVPTVVAAAQIGTLVAGGGASAFLLGVATSARVGTVSATGEMSPDATAYLQGVSAATTAGIISAYGSRSKIEVSVTEDDICAAVRKYIMSIAPQGMRVVRTPVNKASMPKGAYVSFTPGLRRDVSTNRDNYSDNGRFVSRSEMMAFQINCYGVGSADLAETLNVLFRDQYGIEQFTGNIVPLYAGATQQAPFVNDADQYEDCYIFEIELQINSQIVVPQASCNMLEIEVISVDATFPPQEVN